MWETTGAHGYLMTEIILKARYVFSAPDKVIDNGVVVINEDKISTVVAFEELSQKQKSKVVDFANAVILPGLVNAHTHLEFTNLHGLAAADSKLISWIEKLIRAKLKWNKPDYISSTENGIQQSLESGTTTVADITNSGYSIDVLHNSPIRKAVFSEVISFDPSKAISTIETAKENFNDFNQDDLFRYGLSPHAPYTASFELYKECSRINDLLLCTHVAETIEEVNFLTDGKGAFIDLLNRFGMLYDSWEPMGLRPVEYLGKTGILRNRPLLIHCNYISDDEISLIQREGSSVVYCPRSHRYFGHKEHPFKKLLDKKVNVAIGTDSLASNNSLSVLDEMKFIYDNVPDIDPKTIVSMGTTNGAIALRLGDKIGRLVKGSYADISIIALPANHNGDVYNGLLSDDSENIFTTVSGTICYDKYNRVRWVK